MRPATTLKTWYCSSCGRTLRGHLAAVPGRSGVSKIRWAGLLLGVLYELSRGIVAFCRECDAKPGSSVLVRP